MTSPVLRDPLGLRHSRPSGFDFVRMKLICKYYSAELLRLVLKHNSTHALTKPACRFNAQDDRRRGADPAVPYNFWVFYRFTEMGLIRTDCFGTSWAPSPTNFGVPSVYRGVVWFNPFLADSRGRLSLQICNSCGFLIF